MHNISRFSWSAGRLVCCEGIMSTSSSTSPILNGISGCCSDPQIGGSLLTGEKGLTLKWKREVLNLPVFREKLRGVGESGTSPTDTLRASTWIGYLKRLGEKAGFQHSFTQYRLRCGLLDVVNSMLAPFYPSLLYNLDCCSSR